MKTVRPICILLLLTIISVTTAGTATLSNNDKLSMELENVPLVTVLNMIAQQNNLNLVMSGDVKGNVTMRLDGVDLSVALDAILTANGYSYLVRDEVIIVKSADSLVHGELITKVFRLSYLNAHSAQKAVEAIKSTRGSIVILDNAPKEGTQARPFTPNRILVTDFPAVIDDVTELLAELDQPERRISIEVKIIETTLDTKTKLGLAWPTAISATLENAATNLTDQNAVGSGSGSSVTTQANNGAFSHNVETGKGTWGILNVAQLQVVLDLLNQDGNSKLISDPHLITLENYTAEISISTIIPIATVNRFTEGAATSDIVTFQDEEVGVILEVTPRINDDNNITLDVYSQVEDIIGFTGPPESQKPITALRAIRTRITVPNGQTAALGGLLEESDITVTHKVPLLGSIPFLGKLLFTHTSKEKSTTDLLILITPKILD